MLVSLKQSETEPVSVVLLILRRFKDMKLAALNLVQLCVGGEAASGANPLLLVSSLQAVAGVALVESYFRRLAERFEDAGLLPWFRRGMAKAVMVSEVGSG